MSYYDNIADGYEELHKEEQLKKLKLISKYLKVKKSDLLLDVGCGTGISTKYWKCKTIGIDPASKLLKKAGVKSKSNTFPKWIKARAEKIPFEDNKFDIVISVTAIQNFSNIEKALKEIKRVGKEKFVLTFLKKSPKREMIDKLIRRIFEVKKIIEEEKDLIYILRKKLYN